MTLWPELVAQDMERTERVNHQTGLRGGHFLQGKLRPFIHICPGEGCAVYQWLLTRLWKGAHNAP